MIPFNINGALQAIRKTSSAMTILVFIIALIYAITALSIFSKNQSEVYMSFLLLFILIIFFLYIYRHFAFNDPDRLHREDHLENIIALRNDIHLFKRNGDQIEAIRIKEQENIANPLIKKSKPVPIYLLSYNPFDIDQGTMISILSNKLIISEWIIAFPGTIYVKTDMTLKNFRDLISLSTNGRSFLTTVVSAYSQDGSMPFDIWSWLSAQQAHQLSHFAPLSPSPSS